MKTRSNGLVRDKMKMKGELVEMFGIIRCVLSDQLKIRKIEVFYDPDTFLKVMEGELKPEDLAGGKAIFGNTTETAIEKIDKNVEGFGCSIL